MSGLLVPNLSLIIAELLLLVGICVVLIVDAFTRDTFKIISYWLAQLFVVTTAIFAGVFAPNTSVIGFSGTFVTDPMSVVLKVGILILTLFSFLYSKRYLLDRNEFRAEYYVLGMTAALGMMILVSAHSLLSLYLGLELLSLSLYAMVAMHRDSSLAAEAAMKYFVLGALASGILSQSGSAKSDFFITWGIKIEIQNRKKYGGGSVFTTTYHAPLCILTNRDSLKE